jgi:osmotically-inducible protein OsmY
MTTRFDAIIIGTGQSGPSLAARLAGAGRKVAIIELMRYYLESHMVKQRKRNISAVFLALTLAAAMGCASTATNESTGEYIDDAVLTLKVKAAILDQPQLKSFDFHVESFKGAVHLRGVVASQSQIDKAVEVARGVNGVRSIDSDMRVR